MSDETTCHNAIAWRMFEWFKNLWIICLSGGFNFLTRMPSASTRSSFLKDLWINDVYKNILEIFLIIHFSPAILSAIGKTTKKKTQNKIHYPVKYNKQPLLKKDKLVSLIQLCIVSRQGEKTLLTNLCVCQETRNNPENHLRNPPRNEKTFRELPPYVRCTSHPFLKSLQMTFARAFGTVLCI